jgi:hypothetical protein
VSAAALQLAAWSAAFWLALRLHARSRATSPARFALALLLGAVLARAGHALLWSRPQHGLAAGEAVSVLFVPLGLLLIGAGPGAFASLPLPLAVARLGCLAAGCCRGACGERLPLYEAAFLVALHGVLARGTLAAAPERFAWAFGGLRLAQSPWRPRVETAPLGGFATPEAVALGWIAIGAVLAARRSVTESGRFPHASVTPAQPP